MPDQITNLEEIKLWYQTGLKPTEEQFRNSWESFHHKHNGVLVKHPTAPEITAGLKTFEVLTNGGAVKIPASGTYPGTMQDLYDELAGVPLSPLRLMKRVQNTILGTIEPGDRITGFWDNVKYVDAIYIGGVGDDRDDLENYFILTEQDFDDVPGTP